MYSRNLSYLLRLFLVFSIIILDVKGAYKRHSVFQKLTTEERLSTFGSLVQNNSLARRAILYWNVTVFAPKNEVFQKFNGYFPTELVYYHVSNELKSLKNIFETNHLHTLADGYPPLWISKIDYDVYVNNAKILANESDFYSRVAGGFYNNNQVLHIIDEVLEPPSIYLNDPTALDIITNFTKDKSLATQKYLERITYWNKTKLFGSNGGNTYFVPIDKGFNEHRYRLSDKYTIDGHIIPNQVLFTRPTLRNFYFETRSNGDYIYMLASFVERNGKLFVRSNTVLGDSNHQKGELLSEVIKANVPVKNGVVHFIERPLGIFDMVLMPFPFLPILSKLSGDPQLNITYQMGQMTTFNQHLENTHSLLTFFVPRDVAWKGLLNNLTEDTQERVTLLGRHLVISDVRHTMKMLWYRSFERVITLNTVGGPIEVTVTKDEEENYSILYENKRIKVYRPDYICTNGIIHIIDQPFIDTDKEKASKMLKMNFWRSLEDFVF
ncbi:hypothetical protein HHI36_021154 [Cryptolaemus montrouzieri]|uniref:FAS1 domain-containing protein n=1 Tax=Cryptolaemus montrouzieri TaxID=559131 RepID=A0ABD2MWR7_9CUCU